MEGPHREHDAELLQDLEPVSDGRRRNLEVPGQRPHRSRSPDAGTHEVDQDLDGLQVSDPFEVQEVVPDDRIDVDPPPAPRRFFVFAEIRLGEASEAKQISDGILWCLPEIFAGFADRKRVKTVGEEAAGHGIPSLAEEIQTPRTGDEAR